MRRWWPHNYYWNHKWDAELQGYNINQYLSNAVKFSFKTQKSSGHKLPLPPVCKIFWHLSTIRRWQHSIQLLLLCSQDRSVFHDFVTISCYIILSNCLSYILQIGILFCYRFYRKHHVTYKTTFYSKFSNKCCKLQVDVYCW